MLRENESDKYFAPKLIEIEIEISLNEDFWLGLPTCVAEVHESRESADLFHSHFKVDSALESARQVTYAKYSFGKTAMHFNVKPYPVNAHGYTSGECLAAEFPLSYKLNLLLRVFEATSIAVAPGCCQHSGESMLVAAIVIIGATIPTGPVQAITKDDNCVIATSSAVGRAQTGGERRYPTRLAANPIT
ncbi:hypothetical protein EVAR_33395_1 [Eumeta japonica]|uniref:Uncharacterized protein n=1 Tax=Eumeta variegata TaxID=151549 RepID=A0A4C1W0Z0_EUMVA|nr:hypothetical protein EVAR_33395_1 [Eumeta japonica]